MNESLIEWKSGFWRNDQVASIYDRLMRVETGVTPIKNQLDKELIARYVVGDSILDVGAGTGRGSLHLAQAGKAITAIDSSQPMLDHYARDASGLSLTCQVADAGNLPFVQEQFDSLVSLNVMVHFPHWREVLAEWARVVRPGGRVVFDLYSQDCEDAARSVTNLSVIDALRERQTINRVTGEVDRTGYMSWLNRVRVADLLEVATQLNLRLVALNPFGVTFFDVEHNFWCLNTLADGGHWRRLQSWYGEDSRLSELVLFLERTVFSRLTSCVAGAYMVAFEKALPGEDVTVANSSWLARNAALNQVLAQGITPSLAEPFELGWDSAWREQLNTLLDWPRSRVLFYFLWSSTWDLPGRLNLAEFLEPRHVEALFVWKRQWQLDQTTTHWLRTFMVAPEFEDQFEWRGVNLRAGLEYELTRELLTDYFKAFV